ncbi:MAG: type VI secretion system tube protein Hcp [Ideonella sp.]|nr:type VI secretion system tube protein Hcp [Ideonella sp.]
MDNTTQIYLNIILESGAVEGESTAGGYERQIDIDGFEFAATAKKATLKDVQKGLQKPNLDMNRVTISKVFDGASLLLANAMQGRKIFSTATISVDQQYTTHGRSAKLANQILIIDLLDGYIADIKLRTSESGAGAQIKEDIELSFHNISIMYYAEKRKDDTRLLTSDWRDELWTFATDRKTQEG